MRLLLVIVYMAGNLAVQAQTFVGDAWSQVESGGKGTIKLAYVETPAFVYKDVTGKLTGICVDIMRDFVEYVDSTRHVKIETSWAADSLDFKGMYDQVRNGSGGVFGLGNITITETRKKEVKFSPPYITNFAILITQSQIPMLTGFEDLKRLFPTLTAYTAKGTLDEKRISEIKQKYYPGLQVSYTTTSQETLEKITTDPNGFGFIDMAFYLKAVRDRKSVKRHPIGDRASEQFGFTMPLNSDWGPLLDEFFAADGGYTNSARYKNILNRHLGGTGVRLLQSGSSEGGSH